MIIVLMGIVLFAALAFVVARGMRSETTTAMSQRQAEPYVPRSSTEERPKQSAIHLGGYSGAVVLDAPLDVTR